MPEQEGIIDNIPGMENAPDNTMGERKPVPLDPNQMTEAGKVKAMERGGVAPEDMKAELERNAAQSAENPDAS